MSIVDNFDVKLSSDQALFAGDKSIQPIPETSPDLSYYDMTGKKYLVIFNHSRYRSTMYFQYKRPSERLGTIKDVVRLSKIFTDMRYEVHTYTDYKYTEILDTVAKISKTDHTSTSCLCFVFLTHGEKGGVLFASDRPYLFKEVTTLLENGHPGLIGKPKIFFIQACRGGKIDDGKEIETDGTTNESIVIPTQADFLVIYSTVEEYVAFRDRQGSFLIQELCDVIEEYHEEWDILHIATLMQRRVAYYRTTHSPSNLMTHEKKQMPETRFSLTKLFKF